MSRRLSPGGRSGRSASFRECRNPCGTKGADVIMYSSPIYTSLNIFTPGENYIFVFFVRSRETPPERRNDHPLALVLCGFARSGELLGVPQGMLV